jgi:hypothetical protein
VLPLHARPFGNERRRHDLAEVPPLGERPVQDVAGPTRFIAHPELAVAGDPLEPLLQFRGLIQETIEAVGAFAPAGIVAGGSGDSVSTREELTHAKAGGQPSHISYVVRLHSGTPTRRRRSANRGSSCAGSNTASARSIGIQCPRDV